LIYSGSSTACVVVLDRTSRRLFAANLGDSGFVVVRAGVVVHRSNEQQHYFNTPYQLAIAPPEAQNLALSDRYATYEIVMKLLECNAYEHHLRPRSPALAYLLIGCSALPSNRLSSS